MPRPHGKASAISLLEPVGRVATPERISAAEPKATATAYALTQRPQKRANHTGPVSFVFLVLLPTIAAAVYLLFVAADQYGSKVAFSVRSNQPTTTTDFLGFTGSSASGPAADGQIVVDFLQSQAFVAKAQGALPLEDIYNREPNDIVFRLGESPAIEDLLDHWLATTVIEFDNATGIVHFEARAFDPEDAKKISAFVLEEAQRLVNGLSEKARSDAVQFAAVDLAEAETRLRQLRHRMRDFRQAELELDPQANARAATDLIAKLETEQAENQVRLNTLRAVLSPGAPRLKFLEEKISHITAQIERERQRIGGATRSDQARPALASLLSRYEALEVELGFAQDAYATNLAIYEDAKAEARRQTRYLAAHVPPTLSERSQYPERWILISGIFALLTVLWLVGLLIIANARNRV